MRVESSGVEKTVELSEADVLSVADHHAMFRDGRVLQNAPSGLFTAGVKAVHVENEEYARPIFCGGDFVAGPTCFERRVFVFPTSREDRGKGADHVAQISHDARHVRFQCVSVIRIQHDREHAFAVRRGALAAAVRAPDPVRSLPIVRFFVFQTDVRECSGETKRDALQVAATLYAHVVLTEAERGLEDIVHRVRSRRTLIGEIVSVFARDDGEGDGAHEASAVSLA